MIATGTPAVQKLLSEKIPQNPELCMIAFDPTCATLSPGHVNASKTGSAAWNVKYGGKMACWRVENCGRGSALKARGPPRKVWKRLLPRRVPYVRIWKTFGSENEAVLGMAAVLDLVLEGLEEGSLVPTDLNVSVK